VPHVLSKSAAAASLGVSPSRLSHWLREKRIDGAAVIGSGHSARIDVDLARRQLDSRLDLSQRLGANGKALGEVLIPQSDDAALAPSATLDAGIKSARLRQLELSNERAASDAAAISGRFVRADEAKQQFGAIAARLMTAFEASFMPIANAIVAAHAQTPQDVLRTMRTTWREVRAEAAKAQGAEALVMPMLVEGDADAVGQP
jgi:hypothetical protein